MSGLSSLRSAESGARGSMSEHSVQMADGPERISVKHRKCCGTLFKGRLTRLTRFSVAVNHGSTFEFSTMFGAALGAKAAAEAGKSVMGIVTSGWIRDEGSGTEAVIYHRENKQADKQMDINQVQASREEMGVI